MEMFKGLLYALLFTAIAIGVCTVAGVGAYWFFK
jgi:hypothetical protein